MFCENCGKENVNGAKFCEGCGNPLTAPEPVTPYPETNGTGNKITAIIVAIILIAVVAGLVWGGISLFGGNKFMKPMNNIIKALEKEDVEYYILAVPEDVVEETKKREENFDEELEDGFKVINEMLEDEYGKNFKVKAKLVEKEKLDKDDIEDLEKEIYLDEIDVDDIDAAYEVEYKITVKGKDDKEEAKFETHIGKIDGKWYFIDMEKDPMEFIVEEFLDAEEFREKMYNDGMYVGS